MEVKRSVKNDKKELDGLISSETILWGMVIRTGQEQTGQPFMIVQIGGKTAASGYRCKVSREDADAEFKTGSLMYLVGHRVPVILTAYDEATDTLQGSRKTAQEQLKTRMLPDLSSGKEMKGTILSFVSYGAYVEVGGVVGLLKNTDYSIDFSEINETKRPGDTLSVKAKEVTVDGKIFWTVPEKVHREKPIEYDIEPETAVIGTVQNIKGFQNGVGVFVRIATGLDALCTVPQNVEVEVGNRVSVHVVSVDPPKAEYMPPRVKGRILRVI